MRTWTSLVAATALTVLPGCDEMKQRDAALNNQSTVFAILEASDVLTSLESALKNINNATIANERVENIRQFEVRVSIGDDHIGESRWLEFSRKVFFGSLKDLEQTITQQAPEWQKRLLPGGCAKFEITPVQWVVERGIHSRGRVYADDNGDEIIQRYKVAPNQPGGILKVRPTGVKKISVNQPQSRAL